MKKAKKNYKKVIKSNSVEQEQKIEKSFSFIKILTFIFKVITFPLYVVYLFVFKIPTDGPAYFIGFLRFVLFVTLSVFMTNTNEFYNFIENFIETHKFIPVSTGLVMGVLAIIMLINLFLSFMEMFGFSTGSYWYDSYDDNSKNSISGYDAIDDVIDYRDSLLRAKHTPGKIEELKKTSFVTKERLVDLGSSPEVNEALVLLNSQMRALAHHRFK